MCLFDLVFTEDVYEDFDDVDLSLRDESKIFKLINDQKEIDESFSFLDKENYEKIKSFWTKFFPTMSVNQKNFKTTWKILLNVYKDYKRVLLKNKIAYKGLVYKEFLKKISSLYRQHFAWHSGQCCI